ncbi:hypothetical protein Nepgr_024997 [Nepenthes gracilis]|uniref:HVA22-like protein n=1 Tax=Nepenthes gracilis TaxID=150966 RepID=A0AAD3T5G1_NEPGR|nr:hypothetical protein Nepgr_024997 [Nepenthes gracilis]
MLGDFINRGLLMILGYAYPAFECFKSVEKNRVNIDELRFWCQYWIIVAVLSIIERFGDVFISWVPLYAEIKLAFIIYLWYPKTKGTSYVYESVLRPFVARHETDIDQNLQEMRLRAWDLAIYYMQNCTQLGQSAFFQVVEFLSNQSTRLKGGSIRTNDQSKPRGSPPPPPTDFAPSWPPRRPDDDDVASAPIRPSQDFGLSAPQRAPNEQNLTRRWPPTAPPFPPTVHLSEARS